MCGVVEEATHASCCETLHAAHARTNATYKRTNAQGARTGRTHPHNKEETRTHHRKKDAPHNRWVG